MQLSYMDPIGYGTPQKKHLYQADLFHCFTVAPVVLLPCPWGKWRHRGLMVQRRTSILTDTWNWWWTLVSSVWYHAICKNKLGWVRSDEQKTCMYMCKYVCTLYYIHVQHIRKITNEWTSPRDGGVPNSPWFVKHFSWYFAQFEIEMQRKRFIRHPCRKVGKDKHSRW